MTEPEVELSPIGTKTDYEKVMNLIQEINEDTTDSRIKEILSLLIDDESEEFKLFRVELIKIIAQKTYMAVKKIEEFYNERHEFHKIELDYVSNLSNSKEIHLHPYGLTYRQYLAENKGVKNEYIYRWDSFEILSKYYIGNSSDEKDMRVDIELNGMLYTDISFSEMKELLYTHAYQGEKGKNLITYVLHQYCEDVRDVSSEISGELGFSEISPGKWGWNLPPRSKFRFNMDQMVLTLEKVKEMMRIKPEEDSPKKAAEFFKMIYENTTIKYKDIIFAWNFAAPFMHCIKQMVKLMPILALGGEGDAGKTAIMDLLGIKLNGTCDSIESKDSTYTESRFCGSLAGSTWPVFIDDAEKMNERITDTAKTHSTTNVYFKRKKGQKFDINVLLVSPICINFNRTPKIFKDPYARQRILYLDIELLKDVDNWELIMEGIPNGYIARYIIDCTKEWDNEFIKEFLLQCDISRYNVRTKRSKKMCQIIEFGKYICKEFLGIELDLTDLPSILENTKNSGLEQLTEAIRHMAIRGSKTNENGKFVATDWVKMPTMEKKYKEEWGVLIDSDRKTEVLLRYDSADYARDTTVTDLYRMVKIKWPNVQYKLLKYEGVPNHFLFIPNEYIIDINMSLEAYHAQNSYEKEGMFTKTDAKAIEEEMEKYEIELDDDE